MPAAWSVPAMHGPATCPAHALLSSSKSACSGRSWVEWTSGSPITCASARVSLLTRRYTSLAERSQRSTPVRALSTDFPSAWRNEPLRIAEIAQSDRARLPSRGRDHLDNLLDYVGNLVRQHGRIDGQRKRAGI